MNEDNHSKWMEQVRCPSCASRVTALGTAMPRCTNESCEYSEAGFPSVNGQPVLIDFQASVFDRRTYDHGTGSVIRRDVSGRSVSSRLHRITYGSNPIAARNCSEFLALVKKNAEMPTVLVIGGATIGSGAASLYEDASIELVSTDVFSSCHTVLVADAHRIPFAGGSMDAVWIQAVLEHVLEPGTVVDEIHRVLKPSGIIYAETPFMQQVHERAFDFTRFTQSGHRWLFRRFTEIRAGPVSGPGVALLWSIRYFFRAMGAGDKLSRAFPLPFFWLRFFDKFSRGRSKADGASGLFFLGRRSDHTLRPADMPSYYDTQK